MTSQPQSPSASRLVAALEAAWDTIRANHPALPAVFVIIGSGDGGGRSKRLRYGHFWALRWQRGEERLHELFVGGEGLKRTPVEVLTTLLHEGAHCLAHVREIQDTSRRGAYHNKRFAALAREMGIEPSLDDAIGWSPCTMPEETQTKYADVLVELTAALDVYRHGNPTSSSTTKDRNQPHAFCGCGEDMKIRVSPKRLAASPIICGTCEKPFVVPDDDQDDDEDA